MIVFCVLSSCVLCGVLCLSRLFTNLFNLFFSSLSNNLTSKSKYNLKKKCAPLVTAITLQPYSSSIMPLLSYRYYSNSCAVCVMTVQCIPLDLNIFIKGCCFDFQRWYENQNAKLCWAHIWKKSLITAIGEGFFICEIQLWKIKRSPTAMTF